VNFSVLHDEGGANILDGVRDRRTNRRNSSGSLAIFAAIRRALVGKV
jgi:hypothetical protein